MHEKIGNLVIGVFLYSAIRLYFTHLIGRAYAYTITMIICLVVWILSELK